MRFTCPTCSKSYRLPPERLGPTGRAQISCPNCKAVVLVKAVAGSDQLDCQMLQGTAGGATDSQVMAAQPVRAAGPASGGFAAAPSWFVVIGRDKVGPLSAGQVAEHLGKGELTIHSLAWQKGMAGWVKIEELPELLKEMSGSRAVAAARESGIIAAAPASPVAAAASQELRSAGAAAPHHPPTPNHAPTPSAPVAQPAAPPAPAPQAVRPTGQAPAVAPAQRAPQAQSAPQPLPKPAAAPSAAKPVVAAQPARQSSPLPKAEQLDDAGPTMEASIPLQLRQPPPSRQGPVGKSVEASKPPASPGKGDAGKGDAGRADARTAKPLPPALNQADVHGDAFFGNHHDLHDVELALPDPNKHKPTKEEYQNLIQEFSVMFRLDKRSKRQKVLIGVVLASLLLGAIGFGVGLTVSANQKRQLIKDSKDLLAAFDLGYKASVTPDLSPEEKEQVAAAQASPGQPLPTIKAAGPISTVANRMLQASRKKTAKAPQGAQFAAAARPAGGDAEKQAAELAKAEALRTAELQKRLAAAGAQYGVVGKQEQVVGAGMGGQAVTSVEIRKLCRERAGDLGACAKAAGAEGGFTAKITIDVMGGVGKVTASVNGAADSSLGSCIKSKLGRVNFGKQPSESSHSCEVN